MTVKAMIAEDNFRGGIRILWRIAFDGQPVQYANTDTIAVETDPAAELSIEPVRLSDEFARSLLTALMAHYHGGEDTRSLRRDYDAERKRVDKMIDALINSPGGTS